MEVDFGMRALYRRVAGIDVHRMQPRGHRAAEQPDGSMQRQTRRYCGFRCDCCALAAWLAELQVELVVMESTGIYWKSVYAHLENAGVAAWVVNAHRVKHVPGRKTDVADSEWLAILARFGLLKASFIPPKPARTAPGLALSAQAGGDACKRDQPAAQCPRRRRHQARRRRQ